MKQTDTYTYTILGNPRPKKRNLKPIIEYAKSAAIQLAQQEKPPIPINTKINLKCIFYRSDKRKTDLTNLLNSICDILILSDVILDDNYNIIIGMNGSRVCYDKENPRVEITITAA